MAKPRVFVSSTFYDLRSVRDDLDRFIREIGFEPVRHERGQIAYGKDGPPEEFAYREIDFCEMLVCIVGGRFGTMSTDGTSSITQKELKSAVERGKQVYVFVEENVQHEHRYYLANKGVQGVRYVAVDNLRIHEFLEEVHALPKGNPVFPFSVTADISRILREQWAGLFQRLLTEASAKPQAALIEELQRGLQTVGQLVAFLINEKGQGNEAVQQILFANHPLFSTMKEVTRNPYRLYFTTLRELEEWLTSARGFTRVDVFEQDDIQVYEWIRVFKTSGIDETHKLYIHMDVFTKAGDIKPMTPASWSESYVKYERQQPKPKLPPKPASTTGFEDMDDDIPF